MATVFIAPTFGVGYQSLTNGGAINAAGYIDTFQAGTTTVTSVYTTSLGTVAHANPIVLDSAGRIPAGGELWLLGGVAMKFVIKDSTSSAIQTIDNIYGINDVTALNNLGPAGATVSSTLVMNGAAINEAQGANVPIVSSVNLQTTTGNYVAFTGTGTVTSITLSQGASRQEFVTNTAAFVNGTTLAMLGNASVTANPGDILEFRGEAGGVVRNTAFWRMSGVQILQPVAASTFLGGSTTGTSLPTFRTLIPYSDFGLTSSTTSIGADVPLTNTANFFTGPSLSVGAIGTWYFSGSVGVLDSVGAANFSAKLWDGTTEIDAGAINIGGTSAISTISLSGIITSPVGPVVIVARDTTSTSGLIKASGAGTTKLSTLTAVRIA